MNKQPLLFMIFMASMFHVSVSHAASVYYVQSVKAKILGEASFKSKVIAEVEKGGKLTSTGQAGSWVKVQYEGKEGYVPSLLLSTHPPLSKTEFIKAEDPEIKQGVRRRASSFTSAAAARGLTKEDRKRADVEEGVDFNALHKMESLALTDDEITQFMNGGK